jgi:hypothetical protein
MCQALVFSRYFQREEEEKRWKKGDCGDFRDDAEFPSSLFRKHAKKSL